MEGTDNHMRRELFRKGNPKACIQEILIKTFVKLLFSVYVTILWPFARRLRQSHSLKKLCYMTVISVIGSTASNVRHVHVFCALLAVTWSTL